MTPLSWQPSQIFFGPQLIKILTAQYELKFEYESYLYAPSYVYAEPLQHPDIYVGHKK